MKISPFINHLIYFSIYHFPVTLLIGLVCSTPIYCGEIHDATNAGDLAKIKTLLKNNPSLISSKDEYTYTPLHWAAGRGYKDVVELLLDKGEHLTVLCKELPKECAPLIIGLGKDAQWEADATGELQCILSNFIREQTDIFLVYWGKLSPKEKENLAYFVADYEGVENDPDYINLLTQFQERKNEEAYEFFVTAKNRRIREGH